MDTLYFPLIIIFEYVITAVIRPNDRHIQIWNDDCLCKTISDSNWESNNHNPQTDKHDFN